MGVPLVRMYYRRERVGQDAHPSIFLGDFHGNGLLGQDVAKNAFRILVPTAAGTPLVHYQIHLQITASVSDLSFYYEVKKKMKKHSCESVWFPRVAIRFLNVALARIARIAIAPLLWKCSGIPGRPSQLYLGFCSIVASQPLDAFEQRTFFPSFFRSIEEKEASSFATLPTWNRGVCLASSRLILKRGLYFLIFNMLWPVIYQSSSNKRLLAMCASLTADMVATH